MLRFHFLLLAFLFITIGSQAQKLQKRVPDDGGNPTPPTPALRSEAFLGTWEWRSGTDVFRLTIRRDRYYRLPNGETSHELLGMHYYSRNGVVVEDAATNPATVAKGRSFIGSPYTNEKLIMFFMDISKQRTGKVLLTIDPATPDQMQFEMQPEDGIMPDTPGRYTLPTSMTLTRVP